LPYDRYKAGFDGHTEYMIPDSTFIFDLVARIRWDPFQYKYIIRIAVFNLSSIVINVTDFKELKGVLFHKLSLSAVERTLPSLMSASAESEVFTIAMSMVYFLISWLLLLLDAGVGINSKNWKRVR